MHFCINAILQICGAGDEIISSRTIYGGTYAFFKNFLPKFNINTKFVDTTNLESVKNAITSNTKVIYCETMSNPMLEISALVAAIQGAVNQAAEQVQQKNLELLDMYFERSKRRM